MAGKYKTAYESLLACVETLDEEEDQLTPKGQLNKARLLRLIHQIAAYTEKPSDKEIDKLIKKTRR